MGHIVQHAIGPLSLAGGIAATAMGQPELGIPLMAGGFGSTVGDVAGGQKGQAIGGALGGLAGMGAGAIPSVGAGATNALGSMAGNLSPSAGNFLAGQGNVGAALASNPALKGITPSMVAGMSGAPSTTPGMGPTINNMASIAKSLGLPQQQQSPMPSPQNPPLNHPPQQAPSMGMPAPSPAPQVPQMQGPQRLAGIPPQILKALGLA